MLGRRKPGGDKPGAAVRSSAGSAKKRKWQEELSDESGSEGKITKADMDAWRRTVEEEERQEQLEREKQETKEREVERRRRDAEEVEQKKKDEEEALAMRDAEEARRAAEEAEMERRRQEEVLAPPGPLPPDRPGALPPGMRTEKMHLYKTTFCKRWEQGNCQFGAACHFAHGERELRGRPPKGSPPGTMSVPLPDEVPKASLHHRGLPAGSVLPVAMPPGLASGGPLPPGMAQGAAPGAPPGIQPPGPPVQRPPMQAHEAAAALNLLSTILAANTAGRGVGPG